MKNLLALFLSVITLSAIAQLNPGDIYLGGGFCFETESSSSTSGGTTFDGPQNNEFALNIFGQYALNNNISVGGGLAFETESQTINDEFSSSDYAANLFSFKGAARYWTSCGGDDSPVKPFVQAEIRAGFGKADSEIESGGETFTYTDDLFNFSAGLRAGIFYELNDHWGASLSTGRIGYWSEKQSQSDFSTTLSGFDFKASLKKPQLSLIYLIRPTLAQTPN